MERREFLAGAAAGGAVLALPAQAQAYPTRIITVVVPFGAGSGTDVTGRIVAHSLGPALGLRIAVLGLHPGQGVEGRHQGQVEAVLQLVAGQP